MKYEFALLILAMFGIVAFTAYALRATRAVPVTHVTHGTFKHSATRAPGIR